MRKKREVCFRGMAAGARRAAAAVLLSVFVLCGTGLAAEAGTAGELPVSEVALRRETLSEAEYEACLAELEPQFRGDSSWVASELFAFSLVDEKSGRPVIMSEPVEVTLSSDAPGAKVRLFDAETSTEIQPLEETEEGARFRVGSAEKLLLVAQADGAYSLEIADDIAQSGCLLPVLKLGDIEVPPEEYQVQWFDAEDGTPIQRRLVTQIGGEDLYTVGKQGEYVNVALDNGAERTYRAVVTISGTPYEAVFRVPYADELKDGGFQQIHLESNSCSNIIFNDDPRSPYWKTTANFYGNFLSEIVQIISSNDKASVDSQYHWNSNAPIQDAEGNGVGGRFAELNAESAGALYQTVLTTPGATLNWALSHRARGVNTGPVAEYDEMFLVIMSEAKASKYQAVFSYGKDDGKKEDDQKDDGKGDTILVPDHAALEKDIRKWASEGLKWGLNGAKEESVNSATVTDDDGNTILIVRVVSDDQDWHSCEGTFTVPEGQHLTRFFFMSGATASGDSSVGNFLDQVHFSASLPPVPPGQARLILRKTVSGLSYADFEILRENLEFTVIRGKEEGIPITGEQFQWVPDGSGGWTGTAVAANVTISTDPWWLETYTVTEDTGKAALPGYTLNAEPASVSVEFKRDDYKGTDKTASFVNQYESKWSLLLQKLDPEDKPLSGAVFSLSAGGGEPVSLTTGPDGRVSVPGKAACNTLYTLTETTPPEGYVPLEKPVYFMIGGNGEVTFCDQEGTALEGDRKDPMLIAKQETEDTIALTVRNRKAGFELPATGGAVKWFYPIGGAVLLVFGWELFADFRRADPASPGKRRKNR